MAPASELGGARWSPGELPDRSAGSDGDGGTQDAAASRYVSVREELLLRIASHARRVDEAGLGLRTTADDYAEAEAGLRAAITRAGRPGS